MALHLADDLEELSSAEDFFHYFDVPFDPHVVQVNRLHILQRFHDYMAQGKQAWPDQLSAEAERSICRKLLERAYQDFIESDALTEKVFKVFKMQEPQSTFVPLDDLLGG